jgi:hypothetical protein
VWVVGEGREMIGRGDGVETLSPLMRPISLPCTHTHTCMASAPWIIEAIWSYRNICTDMESRMSSKVHCGMDT